MQIKYIETKKLTKNIIDYYRKNNDINFDIYGKYKNLLFIRKNDTIGAFDINTKEFVCSYHYGNSIHWCSCEGEYYFFNYYQNSEGKVTAICLYNKNFEVEKHFDMEYHARFNLKMDLHHKFDKEGEYYIFNYKYNEFRGCCTNETMRFYIHDDDKIELSNSTKQLKEETLKINENYINVQNERITNDKWDGMSKFKYKMAIITKNNLYGVINDKYEVVFDYNPDIIYIEVLSFDTLLIESKNNEKFIYNINTKTTEKYNENISLDNMQMLKDNIYRLRKENKYELYIDNKLYDGLYDDIYIKKDLDIIILKNNNKTKFIDIEGNVLFELNDSKFFLIQDEIYYQFKDDIYIFNLTSLQNTRLGNSNIQTEDNKEISYRSDQIFNTYKYYYRDPNTQEIVLYKGKKYGIIIEDRGVSAVRWFDSYEKMIEVHKLILENMFPPICEDNELPKKLKKSY